jgi:hypothetical protein
MLSMFHRSAIAATALLLACGPTVEEEPDIAEGTGTSTGPWATTTSTGSEPGTTGTVSTSTDSSDGDPADDGSAFLILHDGGTVCGPPDPSGELAFFCRCDVWTQDCPDGSKCAPWANDGTDKWSATKCAPLDPNPDPVGAPCTIEGTASSGVDTCELGAMCWNVDPDTLEGHCVGFCGGNKTNPSCSDPQDTCAVFNSGTLILCLPACDPLDDACGDGFACRPKQPSSVAPGFVCLPTEAGGQVIDGCEGIGGCPVGHACTGQNVCAAYCDLGDPLADESCNVETEGHVCTPFFPEPMVPPQYANVGVCSPR